MAKPLPPAPIGTEPTPKNPEKTAAYVSKTTWAQMRDWLNLLQKLLKGWTNDGVTVTIPENLVVTGTVTSALNLVQFQAGNASGQSIPGGSIETTLINWTTNINDGGGVLGTPIAGQFVVPRAGYYFVEIAMFWASAAWTAGTIRYARIHQNALAVASNLHALDASVTDFPPSQTLSILLKCAAGDAIYVTAINTETTARSLYNQATYTQWSITQIA